jgi:hypothetical protein
MITTIYKPIKLRVISFIKDITLKLSFLRNLRVRCFWVSLFLIKLVFFLDIHFYLSILAYVFAFYFTVLNSSFHKRLTELHFQFLLSSFGLEWTFKVYIKCSALMRRLEVKFKSFSTNVRFFWAGLFLFILFAGIGEALLFPLNPQNGIFFCGFLLFIQGLVSYYDDVLFPIYYPVRNASNNHNHKKAGSYQISFFYQTSTLEMPFGHFGESVDKDILEKEVNKDPVPLLIFLGIGGAHIVGYGQYLKYQDLLLISRQHSSYIQALEKFNSECVGIDSILSNSCEYLRFVLEHSLKAL